MSKKLFFLVYGKAKTGKTTLCNSAPGPRLLLDAESGSTFLDSEQVIWDINAGEQCPVDGTEEDITCVVYVHDAATVDKVYGYLDTADHPFKSVILDSVSEIQQRYIDSLVGDKQLRIQDWGEIRRQVTLKLRVFRDLVAHPRKQVHVFATATAHELVDDSGRKRITPYLQGSASQSLPYLFDLVTYLYRDPETNAVTLQCGGRAELDTGDRTGALPESIVNPDIEDIIDIVGTSVQKKIEARKAKKAIKTGDKK